MNRWTKARGEEFQVTGRRDFDSMCSTRTTSQPEHWASQRNTTTRIPCVGWQCHAPFLRGISGPECLVLWGTFFTLKSMPVVYPLTQITRVPPATFTEISYTPTSNAQHRKIVVLTFRNTRFQPGIRIRNVSNLRQADRDNRR